LFLKFQTCNSLIFIPASNLFEMLVE
jgi:hypothetical protein